MKLLGYLIQAGLMVFVVFYGLPYIWAGARSMLMDHREERESK